jgi:hypothetical protein
MKRRIFTFHYAAFFLLAAVLFGAGSIDVSANANRSLSSSLHSAHTSFFNFSSKSANSIRENSTTNISETLGVQQDSARVQFIHNAADSTADTLNVYINGMMLLDNFAFRTATPFMNVNAGQDMVISFVNKDSADTTGAVFTDTVNFEIDGNYIVVASGHISDTGYTPMQPFMLHTMEMARDTSVSADSVDVLFYHGATDAPAIDITVGIGALPLADSLSYGMFSDYKRSDTTNAPLQVMVAGADSMLGIYTLPLRTFALGGSAITVLASGYMDQENNSNGPAFGLFMADPQGGKLVPLPQSPGDNEARIQVIHVSNDINADTVDVYVNDIKVVDNLEFASASPFMNVTEGQNVVVSFNSSNSTDTTGAVFRDTVSFTAGNTYILVASGSSTDTISPVTRGIQLNMYEPAQEISGTSAMVDVLIYHGATSAPAINVDLGGEAATLAGNISYGEFSGYTSIDTNNVNIDVSAAEGDSLIGSYLLPLQELNARGRAFTIVAAGTAPGDTTSEDSTNANQLSLWVASSEGGPLMQLNSVLASAKKVDNNTYKMVLFPNPASQGYTNISYELSRPEEVNFNIYDLKGSLVRKISQGNRVPGQYLLNISTLGLNRGLYLMRMETKTTISTLKLVVE